MSDDELTFYKGEKLNEYGTPVSVFVCHVCGVEFTICPAVNAEKLALYCRDGCGSNECDSYDPSRDANVLFGDYSMFNRYCERKGYDPKALSHMLLSGDMQSLPVERDDG